MEVASIDLQYMELVEKLQQGGLPQKVENYKLDIHGIIMYKNRVYVPNVQGLKLVILREMHNVPYVGHPGY